MIYILSLLIVALAAMSLAVAAVRRPLICCPAAGFAAGVLLVLGVVLAIVGHWGWAVPAGWLGLICGAWGGWHAFVQSARERGEATAREAWSPPLAEHRYDLTGHTVTVEDGPGGPVVVERSRGRLFKVVRTSQELAPGETPEMVAEAAASAYSARYVPAERVVYAATSSAARHDIAVENILGGAR